MVVLGDANVGSYMSGDADPEKFDFGTYLDRTDILTLLVTSAPIQKQCIWLPSQALHPLWEFVNGDKPFTAMKYDKPYTFTSFTEWLMWMKGYLEIKLAMIWSYSFADSICAFFSPNDKPISQGNYEIYYGELEEGEQFTKMKAFYPLITSNGYRISKLDEFGEPEIYEINVMKQNMRDYTDEAAGVKKITYHIHASRVVSFHALPLELGFTGTSKLQTTGHLAIVQRQMLRSVFVQMKNLAAGILMMRAAGEDEKKILLKAVKAQYSHLTKVFYSGPEDIKNVMELFIPDMKIDQLGKVNLMLQKLMATSANLSIRTLGEEDIGGGIGNGDAQFSHTLIKSEIEDIQRHYQSSIEHCFHKLGLEDTAFVWNQPIIEDDEVAVEENVKEKENQSNTDNKQSNSDKNGE